jgi:hypothetical protein
MTAKCKNIKEYRIKKKQLREKMENGELLIWNVRIDKWNGMFPIEKLPFIFVYIPIEKNKAIKIASYWESLSLNAKNLYLTCFFEQKEIIEESGFEELSIEEQEILVALDLVHYQ